MQTGPTEDPAAFATSALPSAAGRIARGAADGSYAGQIVHVNQLTFGRDVAHRLHETIGKLRSDVLLVDAGRADRPDLQPLRASTPVSVFVVADAHLLQQEVRTLLRSRAADDKATVILCGRHRRTPEIYLEA